MASGTEAAHVQIDQADHDEGEGGRGQPGAPVMHPELLKEEHRPPVVKGRLLQPGQAVEIGGYAGAELVFKRGRGIHPVEHLVGNLGIARLVRAYQPQPIAAQVRCKPVCEKEHGKKKKNGNFADGGPAWEPQSSAFGQIRSGGFQEFFHGQRFSSSSSP